LRPPLRRWNGGDRLTRQQKFETTGAPTFTRDQVFDPDGVEDEPADHALGRSRGGWTTKTHLACEQGRKVWSVVITAGQRGDSPQFTTVLDTIAVPRLGPGRPRTRPDAVPADKVYSSAANRAWLRQRGIKNQGQGPSAPTRRSPPGIRGSGEPGHG
jgi:Transposase DDE domain